MLSCLPQPSTTQTSTVDTRTAIGGGGDAPKAQHHSRRESPAAARPCNHLARHTLKNPRTVGTDHGHPDQKLPERKGERGEQQECAAVLVLLACDHVRTDHVFLGRVAVDNRKNMPSLLTARGTRRQLHDVGGASVKARIARWRCRAAPMTEAFARRRPTEPGGSALLGRRTVPAR